MLPSYCPDNSLALRFNSCIGLSKIVSHKRKQKMPMLISIIWETVLTVTLGRKSNLYLEISPTRNPQSFAKIVVCISKRNIFIIKVIIPSLWWWRSRIILILERSKGLIALDIHLVVSCLSLSVLANPHTHIPSILA